MFATTLEELVKVLHYLFKIFCTNWMTLQPKKFTLATPDTPPIKYVGLYVGAEWIAPDNTKIQAITEMREPQNISEVRSLLGCINQLMHFFPDLSCNISSIRRLLLSGSQFSWNEEIAKEFEFLKKIVLVKMGCQNPRLREFYVKMKIRFILLYHMVR